MEGHLDGFKKYIPFEIVVYRIFTNVTTNSFNIVIIVGSVCLQECTFSLRIFDYAGRGTRCSSVVRAFAHGTMGHRIDPSWGGPIELFLVPASAPRLV